MCSDTGILVPLIWWCRPRPSRAIINRSSESMARAQIHLSSESSTIITGLIEAPKHRFSGDEAERGQQGSNDRQRGPLWPQAVTMRSNLAIRAMTRLMPYLCLDWVYLLLICFWVCAKITRKLTTCQVLYMLSILFQIQWMCMHKMLSNWQCFKYRISAIYRSAKLCTRYRILDTGWYITIWY